MSTAWFLIAGILISLAGLPRQSKHKTFLKTWGTRLLQLSVVLLGARIPISELVETGRAGLAVSFASVTLVLVSGFALRRWIALPEHQAMLITSGTAICGGSAIAAVGPTLQAKSLDMGVSIAVVFILNALAALIFPPMGRALELTDAQFAAWSALAIHDTSSVVAAASQWSDEALRLATTIKLSRTLWIFPMVVLFLVRRPKGGTPRPKLVMPWFIGGFILMSLGTSSTSWIGAAAGAALRQASHWGFAASLLFIGASIPREQLKKVGASPLLFGGLLWLLTLGGSLLYVKLLSSSL